MLHKMKVAEVGDFLYILYRLSLSCHSHLLACSSSFSASLFWKSKPLKRISLSMDSTSAIFLARSFSSVTLVSFRAVRFNCSIISGQMQKSCQLIIAVIFKYKG